MMVGIPGSGKSFFASQFADTFHAPYIDTLAIEKLSRDSETAGELISLMIGELAKTHQTFVFEGNSDARTHRAEFSRWARSKGYQPLLVWVQTDQRTALKRALKNGSVTRESFDTILHAFSAPHADEKPIVISGRHTYASQARVVLAVLSKDARPAAEPTPVTPAPRPTAVQPPRRNVIVR
jgi:gluconate kinase